MSEQPVLGEFVKELLAAEQQRRASLEARGTSVLTVSGTLVTLLLGFAAFVTNNDDFKLAAAASSQLSASVAAFVVASLLAIATYAPQPERIVTGEALQRDVPRDWDRSAAWAEKKVTATRLSQLTALQRSNDVRAWILAGASAVQVVAVALLAWAVIGIL